MNFNTVPKASEVIEAIKSLIDKHGDLPICADDPDSGWRMRIGIVFKTANVAEEWPKRFEVKTDYIMDPKGLIGQAEEEKFV